MGLIERCYRIPSLSATEKQITRLHSIALFEKLNMISSKTHMPDVENEAAKYDSVYFNEVSCFIKRYLMTFTKYIQYCRQLSTQHYLLQDRQ